MQAFTTASPILDRLIPQKTIGGRHQTIVRAPAPLVFEAACSLDLRSVPLVRAIFWLRAKILGAKEETRSFARGFVPDMFEMGWRKLAGEDDRYLVAGAVCQPWLPDVVFRPIIPNLFPGFCEPNYVKIVWTLEVEPLGKARTRFATETRAAGTDLESQAKLLRYWRRFGVGIVTIRWLLLAAVRREAQERWRKSQKTKDTR